MPFLPLLNRKLNLLDTRLRRSRLISRPVTLLIETTNRCNSVCIMCRSPEYRETGAWKFGDMTVETLERTRAFWRSATQVVLGGNGECFLNPHYLEMAERVKQAGSFVHTYTNGILLRPRTSERLVRMGFDLVHVSFAGAQPSTYRAIRGIDGFSEALANIRALRDLKNQHRSVKPMVRLNIVAMNSTLAELPETVELAAEVGVSGIDLPHLHVYYDRVRPESPWLDVPAAQRMLREAARTADRLGLDLCPPSFEQEKVFCHHPFSTLEITWQGRISTCVPHRFWVGNLSEEPIERIWNNSASQGVRRRVWQEGYARLCPSCPGWDRSAQGFDCTQPATIGA